MRADDDTTWQGITVLVGGKEIGRMKTWKSSDSITTDDIPAVKGLVSDHYVEEEFEVETLSEEEAHLTLDAQLDMWGFFKDRAGRRSIPSEYVGTVSNFMYSLGFKVKDVEEKDAEVPSVTYTDFKFNYVSRGV